MPIDERLLPAGIADDRSRAVLELIERLEEIDRSILLIYRIDTTPAAALYALAWQFSVTGLAGWDLTHSDEEKRALIRGAIERHRYRGTGWAIRNALAAVGYGASVIEEGVAAGLDHWAKFRIRVGEVPDNVELTAQERELIVALTLTYKNARSHLESLLYTTPAVVDNSPAPTDPPMSVFVGDLLLYDGAFTYNGVHSFSGSTGEPIEVP